MKDESKPQPQFVFLVADYYATGEGVTINILIETSTDKDKSRQKFLNFVGTYFSPCVEELLEADFRQRYENLIPVWVNNVLLNKNVSELEFFQSYHFNRS